MNFKINLSENFEGNNHVGELGVYGEDNIQMDLKDISFKLWTDFICLRIHWRAHVNLGMNAWVRCKAGNYSTS
jgi:hypothetical protein